MSTLPSSEPSASDTPEVKNSEAAVPGSDSSEASNAEASPDEAANGPLTLRLAVLGLWIEAVFAAGLTIFQLVEVFVASPSDPVMAVLLAGFTGALAVLLYRLGALLTNRRVWPRGVAIVVQLLAVPVAYFMITGEGDLPVKAGGFALGAYCLACAGLLLAPASRLALLKTNPQAAER